MITFECTTCGTQKPLQNTKAQGARIKQPCSDCGDVTCFEVAEPIPHEIDDKARAMLRSVNPTIMVKTNYTGDKHLHIPKGETTLCETGAEVREVAVDAYPKGYHDWCSNCIDVARTGNGCCTGGSKQHQTDTATKEACIQAIRHANQAVDGKLTEGKYRDWGNKPTVYRLREHFGKFTNAREKALGQQ